MNEKQFPKLSLEQRLDICLPLNRASPTSFRKVSAFQIPGAFLDRSRQTGYGSTNASPTLRQLIVESCIFV